MFGRAFEQTSEKRVRVGEVSEQERVSRGVLDQPALFRATALQCEVVRERKSERKEIAIAAETAKAAATAAIAADTD